MFQLEAAYSTLSDPEQRRLYDLHYPSIRSRHATTAESGKTHSRSQENNKGPDSTQSYKKEIEKLNAALQDLYDKNLILKNELFEAKRERDRSQRAFEILEEEASQDAREEAKRNSWFSYPFVVQLTAEEKEARQRRMIDNRAARTVREAELKRHKACIDNIEKRIDHLATQIQKKKSEKQAIQEREFKRQEAVRLAEIRRQEALRREKEEKAREEAERIRRQQEAERLRRAQEAEILRREQERLRKEQEAERLRREKEAARVQEERARESLNEYFRMLREEIAREEQIEKEAMRKANRRRAKKTTGSTSCLHRAWWTQEMGRHTCERCLATTPRFAFRCPGCDIVACANCRVALKGR